MEAFGELKFKEFTDLLLAWVVLSFCFSFSAFRRPRWFLLFFIAALFTVGLGFVVHELAHRYIARKFGCWAEFRLWPLGLLLALVSAIATMGYLVFAAPGAVYIIPISVWGFTLSKREMGIIALAGPLANAILAMIFYLLSGLGGILGLVFLRGFRANLWLALFNLTPIPPMDGYKVMNWSFIVWICIVGLLVSIAVIL